MCSLTPRCGVRFSSRPLMPRIGLVLAVAALTFSGSVAAAGKTRVSGKKPAIAVPPSPRKGAPSVKLRPVDDAVGETPTQSSTPANRGPTRIDFDDRLIQGQTNKSGAVYLYDRKELKTRSMIKKRDSFRDEIVSTVYDG